MDYIRAFEVELDRSVYYAGEVLTGHVYIEVEENMRLLNIKVFLRGKAHAEWKITRAGERRTMKQDEHYLDERLMIWGKDDSDSHQGIPILSRGRHRYPFQFQLPETVLPCSFESKIGNIRYYVRVNLNIPYASCPQCIRYFTIIGPQIDCADERYLTPVTSVAKKNSCSLCCGKGPMLLRTTLDRTSYVCGEQILLKAEIQNGGTSEAWVLCKLIQYVEFFINKGVLGLSKEVRHTVLEVESEKVPPHETASLDGLMAKLVVPIVPPTMIEVCGLIQIYYTLKIYLETSKGKGDTAEISMPITIATVPYRAPKNTMPEIHYVGNLTNIILVGVGNLTNIILVAVGNLTNIILVGVGTLTNIILVGVGNLTNIILVGVGNLTNIILVGVGTLTNIILVGVGNLTNIILVGVGTMTNIILVGVGNLTNIILVGVGNVTNITLVGVGNLTNIIPVGVGNLTNIILVGVGNLTNIILVGVGNLINIILVGVGTLTNIILVGVGNLTNIILVGVGNLTNITLVRVENLTIIILVEVAASNVEGGMYISPEFQLGQVYMGDEVDPETDQTILYRPVYVCVSGESYAPYKTDTHLLQVPPYQMNRSRENVHGSKEGLNTQETSSQVKLFQKSGDEASSSSGYKAKKNIVEDKFLKEITAKIANRNIQVKAKEDGANHGSDSGEHQLEIDAHVEMMRKQKKSNDNVHKALVNELRKHLSEGEDGDEIEKVPRGLKKSSGLKRISETDTASDPNRQTNMYLNREVQDEASVALIGDNSRPPVESPRRTQTVPTVQTFTKIYPKTIIPADREEAEVEISEQSALLSESLNMSFVTNGKNSHLPENSHRLSDIQTSLQESSDFPLPPHNDQMNVEMKAPQKTVSSAVEKEASDLFSEHHSTHEVNVRLSHHSATERTISTIMPAALAATVTSVAPAAAELSPARKMPSVAPKPKQKDRYSFPDVVQRAEGSNEQVEHLVNVAIRPKSEMVEQLSYGDDSVA
ncbi:Arrestin domain-containing protein 3 [Bulinus truncatus]|nr:Arrestin domain-containing protein 3 [Bulinus truncatus]